MLVLTSVALHALSGTKRMAAPWLHHVYRFWIKAAWKWSTVHLVREKRTGQQYACKSIGKVGMTEEELEDLRIEVQVSMPFSEVCSPSPLSASAHTQLWLYFNGITQDGLATQLTHTSFSPLHCHPTGHAPFGQPPPHCGVGGLL